MTSSRSRGAMSEAELDVLAADDDPLCCDGILNMWHYFGTFLSSTPVCTTCNSLLGCCVRWPARFAAAVTILPLRLRNVSYSGIATLVSTIAGVAMGLYFSFMRLPTLDTQEREGAMRAILWLFAIATCGSALFVSALTALVVLFPLVRQSRVGLQCGLLWMLFGIGGLGGSAFLQLGLMSGALVHIDRAR